MRQSGKTTLIRGVSSEYLTLDDDRWVRTFETGDWSLIEGGHKPFAIDECQKFPPLFDRIKLLVDQRRSMGQFILTGSVRFLSKRQIRESLTGRTVTLELLPLTLAESHEAPPSKFIAHSLKQTPSQLLRTLEKTSRFRFKEVETYLSTGGLPGICFRRESGIRSELFRSQLETLLGRDIQLVQPTRVPFPRLLLLFSSIASQQGMKINLSILARKLNTSVPTVKNLLGAMESLFLIRGFDGIYYVEDQGLASSVIPISTETPLHRARRVIFQELWSQLSYGFRGKFKISPYQTRGGIEVPFLIQLDSGKSLAICVDETQGATDKTQKSLSWLQKKSPATRGIILHQGNRYYLTVGGHLAVPHYALF